MRWPVAHRITPMRIRNNNTSMVPPPSHPSAPRPSRPGETVLGRESVGTYSYESTCVFVR